MAYYAPTTYPDFQKRSGVEQSGQETKIKNAFDAAEVDILANASQIQLIKGGAGAPVSDLIELYYLSTAALNPGHLHDSTSLTGLPSHNHPYTEITGAPWALQTDFDDLAGGGWPGPTRSVMGNYTLTQTNATNLSNLKGGGWLGSQTVVEAFRLITSPFVISPGHMHLASDITGIGTAYVTRSEFDALAGSGWVSPTENMHAAWVKLTTGGSPGHTHIESEITDLQTYATVTMLNAVKGGGWTTETVYGNNQLITATRGGGWIAQWTNTWLASQIYRLDTDYTTIGDYIAVLQDDMTNIQGTGYTLAATPLVNVTGVTITYPASNGTAKGTYNLEFIHKDTGPTTYHRMRWAGGVIVDLSTGSGTYTLYDVSAVTYINVYVVLASVPASDQTDVVTVDWENVHDLYLKYAEITTGSTTTSHIQVTHEDGIIGTPVVYTDNNGTSRIVYFSGIEGNIGGVKYPTGTSTLTDSQALTVPAAGKLRVDVLSLNTSGTLTYTTGTETDESEGVVYFPTVPALNAAFAYVVAYNSRNSYDGDIIPYELVKDWQTRWRDIKDAVDFHGDGIDQAYGYTVEQARNIHGIRLSVDRMVIIEDPTNNTNVNLYPLNDSDYHVRHYNTSPLGSYELAWDGTAGTMTWGGGATVAFNLSLGVGVKETHPVYDSSGTTGVLVEMTGSVIGDATDGALEVGLLGPPARGQYTIEWDASTSQLRFDSGTWTTVSSTDDYVDLQGKSANGSRWVRAYIKDFNALPQVDTTDHIRVAWNGITELSLAIQNVYDAVQSGPGPIATMGAGESIRDNYGWYFGDTNRYLLVDTTSVDEKFVMAPGRIAMDLAGEHAKFLGRDTSTAGYMMNSDLTLTEGGRLRLKMDSNDDHFPLDWGTIHHEGHLYAAYDEFSVIGWYGDDHSGTPDFRSGKKFMSALTSGLDQITFTKSFVMPADFVAFYSSAPLATVPALTTTFQTDTTYATVSGVDIKIYKAGNGTPLVSRTNLVSGTAGQVMDRVIQQQALAGQGIQAGDRLVVACTLKTRDSSAAWLWDTKMNYRITPLV